jgi:hypothetical protein
MPLPTEFRKVEDHSDLRRLTDFGNARDLGYPGFRDWWHEKATHRIETGLALSIIAVHQTVVIAGQIIYLFPEENRVEFKFFRSSPEHGDEGIGTYLWRQGEVTAWRELGSPDDQPITLTLDTPETNAVDLDFFRGRGCQEVGREHLYTPERRDVKLVKQIQPPRRLAD